MSIRGNRVQTLEAVGLSALVCACLVWVMSADTSAETFWRVASSVVIVASPVVARWITNRMRASSDPLIAVGVPLWLLWTASADTRSDGLWRLIGVPVMVGLLHGLARFETKDPAETWIGRFSIRHGSTWAARAAFVLVGVGCPIWVMNAGTLVGALWRVAGSIIIVASPVVAWRLTHGMGESIRRWIAIGVPVWVFWILGTDSFADGLRVLLGVPALIGLMYAGARWEARDPEETRYGRFMERRQHIVWPCLGVLVLAGGIATVAAAPSAILTLVAAGPVVSFIVIGAANIRAHWRARGGKSSTSSASDDDSMTPLDSLSMFGGFGLFFHVVFQGVLTHGPIAQEPFLQVVWFVCTLTVYGIVVMSVYRYFTSWKSE